MMPTVFGPGMNLGLGSCFVHKDLCLQSGAVVQLVTSLAGDRELLPVTQEVVPIAIGIRSRN